jgi:hypothetical protein
LILATALGAFECTQVEFSSIIILVFKYSGVTRVFGSWGESNRRGCLTEMANLKKYSHLLNFVLFIIIITTTTTMMMMMMMLLFMNVLGVFRVP